MMSQLDGPAQAKIPLCETLFITWLWRVIFYNLGAVSVTYPLKAIVPLLLGTDSKYIRVLQRKKKVDVFR